MSPVRGCDGGEQVPGESERRSRRPEGTREGAIRERAAGLLLRWLGGKPARSPAAKYGIAPRRVAAGVASLPVPGSNGPGGTAARGAGCRR